MLNTVKHLALGLARDSTRSFVSLRMTLSRVNQFFWSYIELTDYSYHKKRSCHRNSFFSFNLNR